MRVFSWFFIHCLVHINLFYNHPLKAIEKKNQREF